jgi:hypothetical protein
LSGVLFIVAKWILYIFFRATRTLSSCLVVDIHIWWKITHDWRRNWTIYSEDISILLSRRRQELCQFGATAQYLCLDIHNIYLCFVEDTWCYKYLKCVNNICRRWHVLKYWEWEGSTILRIFRQVKVWRKRIIFGFIFTKLIKFTSDCLDNWNDNRSLILEAVNSNIREPWCLVKLGTLQSNPRFFAHTWCLCFWSEKASIMAMKWYLFF